MISPVKSPQEADWIIVRVRRISLKFLLFIGFSSPRLGCVSGISGPSNSDCDQLFMKPPLSQHQLLKVITFSLRLSVLGKIVSIAL